MKILSLRLYLTRRCEAEVVFRLFLITHSRWCASQVKIIGPGGEEMSVTNPIHSFNLEKYIKTDRCRQFADVKVPIPWSSPPKVDPKTQMGYYRR